MTGKGYDPFAYGQVRVQKGKAAAGSPEDILFGGGDAAPPSAKATADTSWDPPPSAALDMGGVDFSRDILGAEPARPAAPKPGPTPVRNSGIRRAVVPTNSPEPVTAHKPQALSAAARAAAQKPAGGTPSSTARKLPAVQPTIQPLPLPGHGGLTLLAPLGIAVLGGGVTVWLWQTQHNVVMPGIAGLLTLALAGIAWFGLKR